MITVRKQSPRALKPLDYVLLASCAVTRPTEVVLGKNNVVSASPPPTVTITILPNDILYHIFLIGFASFPRTFGLLVSHVCREWRSSALASPVLWSRLVFDHKDANFEREKVWIERSRDALLDVEVREKAFSQSAIKRVCSMMRLIRPQAGRWRSLKVTNIPTKAFIVLSDQLRELVVPSLESLTATQRSWSFGTDWTFRPFHDNRAPRLREVTMRSVPFDWTSSIFDTLRRLSIDDTKLSLVNTYEAATTVYDVLSRSPELEEFVLWAGWPCGRSRRPSAQVDGGASWSVPPPLDVQPLTLPKLSKLVIDSSPVVDTLLQSISIPALAQLSTRYQLTPAMFPIVVQHNHLSALTDLVIDTSHLPVPPLGLAFHEQYVSQLPQLLSTLSSLEDLGFQNFHFGEDKWFTLLARHCPELKRLQLTSCQGVSEGAIRDVVRERKAAKDVSCLEVLWVVNCCELQGISKDGQEWLNANLERFLWP